MPNIESGFYTWVNSDDDLDVFGLHHVSVSVDGGHSESVRSTVQQTAHVVPVAILFQLRLLPVRLEVVVASFCIIMYIIPGHLLVLHISTAAR